MLKYSTYRSIYEEAGDVNTTRGQSASNHMNEMKQSAAALFAEILGLCRKEYLVKLVLVFMLVVSGFTVVGNVFASSASLVKQEKRVVVERGDTLWSIALKNKPAGMKTVVYIEGIKKTSGLKNGNIQAGDILTLPVY